MTEVKVGQVWQDCDKRMIANGTDRQLVVLEVGNEDAICLVTRRDSKTGEFVNTNRRTRVALSRFKPNATGYRLREDAS